MKVNILGSWYTSRHLSAEDRRQWERLLHYDLMRTFYSDLHSQVEDLPEALQVVVFRKHRPPAKVLPDSRLYHLVAEKPAAVRFLLGLVLDDDPPEVTEENAPKILTAVGHLIGDPEPETHDTAEKQEAALQTFKNLEGE